MSDATEAIDAIDRIATLAAAHPVAFLPVRVETRFRRGPAPGQPEAAGELLVRIYPDAVQSDQHEPLLSVDEVEAGRDHWRRAFRDGDERAAWGALLTETTAARAAWIVEQTLPDNRDEQGTGTEPAFSPVETRPDRWHRSPVARALPDRWIVTARRDERRVEAISEPVREGLVLTLRLSGDDGEAGEPVDLVDLSGDGLEVEPDLAWVYDFDEAVRAGMGVRLPLNSADLKAGFATLLVVGVRTTETAEEQADRLAHLLATHRYSRGLAFVPQGARTNNTTEHPTDYPPADPAGATSFPVERGDPLARAGTDGQRAATALGVAAAAFDHVWGADRDEQTAARAMADALWPATMGYAFDQMLHPLLDRSAVDALREWLRAWVRPRGPLPALRIGSVPYGVLPVGSLVDWRPDATEATPRRLVDVIQSLARLWAGHAGDAAHAGRTGDPDRDLVELLGMDASTQTAKVRRTLGFDAAWNVMTFGGIDLHDWDDRQRQVARGVLTALDQRATDFDPRALYLSYAPRADDFAGPLVTPDPLSETDGLAFDYIAWLRTAAPARLRDQAAPPTDEPITALLYFMLRHALLAEYDRSGRRLLDGRELALRFEDREPELVEIIVRGRLAPKQPPPLRTAWERFDLRIDDITGDLPLGAFLADPRAGRRAALPRDVKTVLDGLADYRANLRQLEGLPTAELQRLFTETLDAYSHRLDTWVTSLATRRLAALREAAPRGIYLGCYGWVENLRPDPTVETIEVTLPDGSTGLARTDSDGYVYAPSMLHGATAAVLRSAWRSRSGAERKAYSVDLSSRRVRTALALLDAVRDSQPLGAVLGYQFERGLHEGHPGVELDRFVNAFRALYPIVANKAQDSGQPTESVAARNVVDGLRLLRAWQADDVPFGHGELPAGGDEREAIEAELERLDDAADALGDLLLAESVHQVVRGSAAGAAATLDTLAKGQRPPEPEVATVPRGGTVLHQRVVLVLGDGTTAPGWGTVPATPRSAAAPELNAWLGRLFGPPSSVECRVTPEAGPPTTIGLDQLEVQPIDLLLMVQATAADAGQAELDRRVAWHAVGAAGPDRPVAIDYETTGSPGALPMAVGFELAAAAGRVLGFGTALTPSDLLPPERDAAGADPLASELADRATAATGALATARTALADAASAVAALPDDAPTDLGGLRTALADAASFGLPGAFPPGRHAADLETRRALLTQAASVIAELDRRLSTALGAAAPADVLPAVFGRNLPVVPRFAAAAPDLLAPALATEPDLGPTPDDTVETWFAQAARVRTPLDTSRDLRIYAQAVGRGVPRPRIAQLPLEPGGDGGVARWAALPFASATERPRSGLVSLALLGAAPPAAEGPWAGLLLDAWPEVLPNREEETSVVFQFDAPRAEAPQAILLAVPPVLPGPEDRWSYELLERTLLQTLEQTRIRALDLANLGAYGQVIPLTYLAANTANEAVATSFAELLLDDAVFTEEVR